MALAETEGRAGVPAASESRGAQDGIAAPRGAPWTPATASLHRRAGAWRAALAALDDMVTGRGRLLLVSGNPGSGKTWLCEEIAVEARRRGARVAWGRCCGTDAGPALWPWIQVLRSCARSLGPEVTRGLAATAGPQIARLLPEACASAESAGSIDSAAARFGLFDGVASFLGGAAWRGGLVVLFDDLHEADLESLALLEFVASAVRSAPLLLIATSCDDSSAADHVLARSAAEMARDPRFERISLDAGFGLVPEAEPAVPAEAAEGGTGRSEESMPFEGKVFACVPSPSSVGAENLFRREGDFWTVRYAGTTARLRDAKGLRYLGWLLRHPGREFPVLELVELDGGGPSSVKPDVSMPTRYGSGDCGPILDARARAAYKRRLEELRTEIEECEQCHDLGRGQKARAERDRLLVELRGAVGLSGRDRVGASNVERARSAVTKRIRDQIARIEVENPALGRHLRTSVQTGYTCRYVPQGWLAWRL